MQLTRKKFGFVALALMALGGVAIAGGSEVANFTIPGALHAGDTISAGVTVNQAPMSVTFTSSPAGLVNYTTTLAGASGTVSIPTNVNAAPGSYTIVATPTAGGVSKTANTVALDPGLGG